MIEIYTDGACQANPGGPGGWAFVAISEEKYEEHGGRSESTTNNIMELTAALEALKHVAGVKDKVLIYTDSQYLQKGITDWIKKWKAQGWKRKGEGKIKNLELWKELDSLAGENIQWKWIRGHSSNEYNNRAHDIAQAFSRGEKIELRNSNVGLTGNSVSKSEKTKKAEGFEIESEKKKGVFEIKTFVCLPALNSAVEMLLKELPYKETDFLGDKFVTIRGDEMEIKVYKSGLISASGIVQEQIKFVEKSMQMLDSTFFQNSITKNPLEFPEDLSQWKNIHFQTYLRPFQKKMVKKWRHSVGNAVIRIEPLEDSSKAFEIKYDKEYSWKILPHASLFKEILEFAYKSSTFPDRAVGAIQKSECTITAIVFNLDVRAQNLGVFRDWTIVESEFENLDSLERKRLLEQVYTNVEKFDCIHIQRKLPDLAGFKWGGNYTLIEVAAFWLLSQVRQMGSEINFPGITLTMDLILDTDPENERVLRNILQKLEYPIRLTKPINYIEEGAEKLARFLMNRSL